MAESTAETHTPPLNKIVINGKGDERVVPPLTTTTEIVHIPGLGNTWRDTNRHPLGLTPDEAEKAQKSYYNNHPNETPGGQSVVGELMPEGHDWTEASRVAAAAAGGAIAEEVIDATADFIREERKEHQHTNTPNPGSDTPNDSVKDGDRSTPDVRKGQDKDPHNLNGKTFAELADIRDNEKTPKDLRDRADVVMNEMVDGFLAFDKGDFYGDTVHDFQGIMMRNDYDDVYEALLAAGEAREQVLEGRTEEQRDHLWKGMMRRAYQSEAARVVLAGIQNSGKEGDEDWLRTKRYSQLEIARLEERATRKHVFDLASDAPDELVGRLVKKEDEPKESTPKPKEEDREVGFVKQLESQIRDLKEKGGSESEWARLIIGGVAFAETYSYREKAKSGEKGEYWDAIEKAIQEVPKDLGRVDTRSSLSGYLIREYPNGLEFRDRLQILFSARKHLNDRYIEMSRAGGSLTKMGVNLSGEMPFEGIAYKVQPINPEDFHMLYNARDLFPELSVGDKAELLPDLDVSSGSWLDVGIKNSSLPEGLMSNNEKQILNKIIRNKNTLVNYYKDRVRQDKMKQPECDKKIAEINKMTVDSNWLDVNSYAGALIAARVLSEDDIEGYASIPTFDNSLNSADNIASLRGRMAEYLGSRSSEELSYRILTCTLTFEMLDRNRTNAQGSSDARDLMWPDRKRLYELKKEREPGLDWTVQRYFVSKPNPGEVIPEKEAAKLLKLRKRKTDLEISAERGVLVEPYDYFEGQILSDFFHSVVVSSRDSLKPGSQIRRSLASYILNADGSVHQGGFKNAPFLQMGPDAYSSAGYWGYTISKANQLVQEIKSTTYKKANEEPTMVGWWNSKKDLFNRLEGISPRLNNLEFTSRGRLIRDLLESSGRFNKTEIDKIKGFSGPDDLSVITDLNERREALALVMSESEQIADGAKKFAEATTNELIAKFRLVHALGVVWSGSIDNAEIASKPLDDSIISQTLLAKIRKAIEGSGYIEGVLLNDFKIECDEMGFGKVASPRKARVRFPVDPTLWD